MAPVADFLAQSESKKRFFDRLGLDERNKLHRHLYSNMKAEAVEGWSRISANRNALIPQLRDDPSIEPPYSFGQVDELAVQQEVMHIFNTARKDTRIMYELGRDREGDVEENWIIRWLRQTFPLHALAASSPTDPLAVWHVFRYRDERNVGAAGRRRTADADDTDVASDPAPADVVHAATLHAATLHAAATRNTRSPALPFAPSVQQHPDPGPSASPASLAGSRFFDPVRDAFRT